MQKVVVFEIEHDGSGIISMYMNQELDTGIRMRNRTTIDSRVILS